MGGFGQTFVGLVNLRLLDNSGSYYQGPARSKTVHEKEIEKRRMLRTINMREIFEGGFLRMHMDGWACIARRVVFMRLILTWGCLQTYRRQNLLFPTRMNGNSSRRRQSEVCVEYPHYASTDKNKNFH